MLYLVYNQKNIETRNISNENNVERKSAIKNILGFRLLI